MRAYCLRILILIFYLFIPLGVYSDEGGTLIILYGTPCSGKSTLSKQLTNVLPGDFHVVKKEKIVKLEREALIEKATGVRPQGGLEAVEGILDQLDQYREEIKEINADALQKSLDSIRHRVERGENIIFDICLTDTACIEQIEGIRTLKVLVFAPLSALSERSSKRAEIKHYSKNFEQRRWVNILIAFHHLFRPAEPGEQDLYATASKRELADLYQKYCGMGNLTLLEKENRRSINRLGLKNRAWTSLSPKCRPDLFIHTGIMTREESLNAIVAAFEQLKNPDSRNKYGKN